MSAVKITHGDIITRQDYEVFQSIYDPMGKLF